MKKLCIAIPSYNREKECLFTLKKIINNSYVQKYKKLDQLSLIVSNNSSDENYIEVEAFCNQHGIAYYRQDNNIGLVKNFLFCLTHANAEYSWVIGDDDIINFDLIDLIFEKISYDKTNLIMLNHYAVDENDNILVDDMYCENNKININKIVINNGGLMFISANIYNVEFVKSFINMYSQYLAFPFYLSLCCLLSQKVAYIPQKVIKNVWGNTSWKPLTMLVCFLQKPFLAFSLSDKNELIFLIQKELSKTLFTKANIYAFIQNYKYRKSPACGNESLPIISILFLYLKMLKRLCF